MLGKTLQRALFVLSLCAAAAGGYVAGSHAETTAPVAPPITPLLVTDKTVMGEPIVYPAGPAELTAAIMTLPPGGETPVHVHNVPVAGIVLEGEITVDYGGKGTRTFKQGEAVAEAMLVPHKGTNPTDRPVRIFVLFMGAKGVPATSPVK